MLLAAGSIIQKSALRNILCSLSLPAKNINAGTTGLLVELPGIFTVMHAVR
jgi:hypothetical protein